MFDGRLALYPRGACEAHVAVCLGRRGHAWPAAAWPMGEGRGCGRVEADGGANSMLLVCEVANGARGVPSKEVTLNILKRCEIGISGACWRT